MLVEREQRDGGAFGAGALTLAPPWRLGSLLRERRERAGLDLEALAAQAPRSIDAALLAAIERGDRALSDPELTLVGAVYGVEVAELAPRRVRLVVDLGEGVLGVGDRRAALGGPVGLDEVLERYLELVYSLRGIPQHRPAVLRELDIEVLADALEAGRPEVERRLAQLMALSPGRPRPRRAPAVVWAAGVLVAVTAAGGLVFEQVLDTPAELAAAVTPSVSPPPAQPAPPQPPE
ncbi:MAG: helix-turn-helix domain-containing protein, partial [Acidimicrobiales bacterium]